MREKLFWNLMANSYSKNQIKDLKNYEHSLEITKKYLNKKQKVLEIGCGTGTTALKLAPFVKKIDGTDISLNMVKIGSEKSKEENIKNINFFDSTLFDSKLKKNSYDVVLAFNLIHLVSNRDKAMKRVNELLKPGGLFISKTPCLAEKKIMYLLAFFIRLIIGPIKCFTLSQYKESIKKNDFKIVKEHIYQKEDPPRTLIIARK